MSFLHLSVYICIRLAYRQRYRDKKAREMEMIMQIYIYIYKAKLSFHCLVNRSVPSRYTIRALYTTSKYCVVDPLFKRWKFERTSLDSIPPGVSPVVHGKHTVILKGQNATDFLDVLNEVEGATVGHVSHIEIHCSWTLQNFNIYMYVSQSLSLARVLSL